MSDKNWSEDKLQAECFQWFHNTYPQFRGLLYAVPNGGKRDKITANKMRATGLVPGIPDLQAHYKGKTIFFELKTDKGRVSVEQFKIHNKLVDQDFSVFIIRRLGEFKLFMLKFFEII